MKPTLKARQAEILKYLVTASNPLNIDFFKEKLGKQDRTIRYDMGQLKEICEANQIELRYLTKKGYYIPATQKSAASQLLLQSEAGLRENGSESGDEERFQKIFLYLFARKDRVTAEQLANICFISRSTLTRFLSRLEAWFDNSFSLDAKKAQGYRLWGDEKTLRCLAAKMLTARFRGSYTVEDWYVLLPEELKGKIQLSDMAQICKSIRRMNSKYNIWISNAAYLNLLSYCIARHIRLRIQGTGEKIPPEEENLTYAQELLTELSWLGRGKNEEELRWFSEILRENGIYSEEHIIDEALLNRTVGRIIAHMEERLGSESFQLDVLYQDLFDHLKNFLNLNAQGRVEEENHYILEEVKEHYYFYFEMAQECAAIVEEETGLKLGSTEVCYLAVYLYKDSNHTEDHKKNVLVVCATGKGLSHLLALRIKNVFPSLNVAGQVSPWQLSRVSDLKDVDFIISTIPLENKLVPVVKISRILSEEDIKRIKDFLKYGNLVDEIPMNQGNEASFISKEDAFLLNERSESSGSSCLVDAATTLSKLILTLIEYTAKFPVEYQMSKDAMLGMIIHMSMAVPRWYDAQQQLEPDEEFVKEYSRVKEKYPDVFALMEKFFELVERALRVKISVSERVAFFLYIIEEE